MSADYEWEPGYAPDPHWTICRYCGSAPAAPVDIRGHRGLVFVMQFRKAEGPFCRDCGLATYRSMTISSLWLGWWGLLSMFVNPFTMIINLVPYREIARLPAPTPREDDDRLPMDPGKPLTRRPGFLLFGAAVLAAITYVIIHAATYTPTTTVATGPAPGTCVREGGGRVGALIEVDCSDRSAMAEVLGPATTKTLSGCTAHPATTLVRGTEADNNGVFLCLRLLR